MRDLMGKTTRASLALVALVALSSIASRPAAAQSCSAGSFNEFEVEPCAQDDAHVSSTGAMLFSIYNDGFSEDYYYVTPECSGIVVSCSAPAYYVVDAGSTGEAEMDYSVSQSYGSGTAMAAVNQGSDWAEVDVTQTVYGQAAVEIDSAQTPVYGTDQRIGLCAANCFTATNVISTVPFYTMGQARNVTLVYNEDRAHPRPFVYATVSPASDAPVISGYSLSATLDGAPVTFTNGETTLHFHSPSNDPVRLGGQIILNPGGPWVYDLGVNVTVQYTNGTTTPLSYATKLVVYQSSNSYVGRDWTIANINKLDCDWGSHWNGCLIYGGDGSVEYFRHSSNGVDTAADHTTLYYDGAYYRRTFLDGSVDSYDASGYLVSSNDPFGRSTTFAYDSSKRLVRIIDPRRNGGGAVPYDTLTYSSQGLASIIERGGPGPVRTTTIQVDGNRNLYSVTDPDGVTSYIDYDGSNRLSAYADRRSANSYRTYYSYDAYGKLAGIQLPAVPIDQGNGTTVTQSPSATFAAWQGIGVPTAPTASSPPTAAALGNVQAVMTAPKSRTTRFTVNNWGQPTSVSDPLWATTTIAYAGKNPVAITHPDYSTDSLGYDGLDRVIMSRPANKPPSNYYYNSMSQVDSVRGAGVVAVTNAYNADHTLHSTGDASGASVTYSYNANKEVITATDNAWHQTRYGYDPLFGNQDTLTAPGNRTTVTQFDVEGRPSVVQAPILAAVTTQYDAMNRPTSVTPSGRPATMLGYDALLRTDATDANGNTTHTDYNALGWPVERRDPNGAVDSMYYDGAGRVTAWKNRRGDRMQYTYDAKDRMTSRTGRNIADHFTYYDGPSVSIAVAWNAVERDSMFIDSRLGGGSPVDSTVVRVNGIRYRVLHGQTNMFPMTDSTAILANGGPGVSFQPRRTTYASSGLASGIADGFSGSTAF